MRAHPLPRLAAAMLLLSVPLLASAQQMKVESRGQAEEGAQNEALVASAMSKSIGLPAAGLGQVVFFRSMRSPGNEVEVIADGTSAGQVPAGMYLPVPARAGSHTYQPGNLVVEVAAGETKYVLVTRDTRGQPRLTRASATRFQSAAQRAN